MAVPVRELSTAQQEEIAHLLAEWLPYQRWYAGKGHALTQVRLTQVGILRGGDALAHLAVGVQLDGGDWQTYQVPVSLRADPMPGVSPIGRLSSGDWTCDALTDPDAMTALLDDVAAAPIVDPARTHGVDPAHGGYSVPQLQPFVEPASYRGAPARPMIVEQSNTSILLGDVALVKVFRQLIPGINPDVEVHAALGSVGCRHVARCLGWVNGGWREPASGRWVSGHLAMVQQLLSPSVDGWGLARRRIAAGASFADDAHALGVATGEVHLDLRRALPTRTLSATELGDRLHGRLDQACAAVPELAPMSRPLHERIRALGHLGRPITVQRVHGDYHLGQVLRAADGWKLLDFEGEPGAPMADRVVPDHPLRDVAGMLRSFAYAAAQGGAGLDPAAVGRWRADCERAFFAGYAGTGAADPTADAVILAAYLVDKAAYEAVYEKRNRPDWLTIPMEALAELAG